MCASVCVCVCGGGGGGGGVASLFPGLCQSPASRLVHFQRALKHWEWGARRRDQESVVFKGASPNNILQYAGMCKVQDYKPLQDHKPRA